jgi:hypothetical protein
MLEGYKCCPTPRWLSEPGVRDRLQRAILARDRDAFCEVLRSRCPDPDSPRAFGVMVVLSGKMTPLLVDQTARPFTREDLLYPGLALHMLNVEFLEDGLKVCIDGGVYWSPYPTPSERQAAPERRPESTNKTT